LKELDGPLKEYRKNSTFDWRKVKLIVEDEETWQLRFKFWNFLQSNTLFAKSATTPSLDEQRRLANQRMFAIASEGVYGVEDYIARPDLAGKYSSSLIYYDPSSCVKLGLAFGMFPNVLRTLGSERVLDIAEENGRLENWGCFALTEIGHGSNARGMKTQATYEVATKSFIIHTPDFEVRKLTDFDHRIH